MEDVLERIQKLMAERGISIKELSEYLDISQRVIYRWNSGESKTFQKYIYQLAKIFQVSPEYLLCETDDPTPRLPETGMTVTDNAISFPVIGGVKAGYDRIAYEDWDGTNIEIPRSYLRGRQPNEFFVLRVKGDSMYPDYRDGDHVLVLSQNTLDRAVQVAVVRYGDENATLKRVEHPEGGDTMTLYPINPNYPPVKLSGEELAHCAILGIPKFVIREVEK